MTSNIEELLAYHCPRWNELPDVDLYVDQVVSYIENHIAVLDINSEGKMLTASMVNNYVKMKVVPAPVKKRYTRAQMARLIVICALKRDFSIGELRDMMTIVLKRYPADKAYDLFCSEMEHFLRHVFTAEEEWSTAAESSDEYATIQAVMNAFANKIYAQCVIKAYWEQQAGAKVEK